MNDVNEVEEWLSSNIAKIIEKTGECPHQEELDGVTFCPLYGVECEYRLNEKLSDKIEDHRNLYHKCSLEGK